MSHQFLSPCRSPLPSPSSYGLLAVGKGGLFNFQLPIGVGHPVFLTGIGTHLTQWTTKDESFLAGIQ